MSIIKKQKEDLKQGKNKSYSAQDLLNSIETFIKNNNMTNFEILKMNFYYIMRNSKK